VAGPANSHSVGNQIAAPATDRKRQGDSGVAGAQETLRPQLLVGDDSPPAEASRARRRADVGRTARPTGWCGAR